MFWLTIPLREGLQKTQVCRLWSWWFPLQFIPVEINFDILPWGSQSFASQRDSWGDVYFRNLRSELAFRWGLPLVTLLPPGFPCPHWIVLPGLPFGSFFPFWLLNANFWVRLGPVSANYKLDPMAVDIRLVSMTSNPTLTSPWNPRLIHSKCLWGFLLV